MILVDPARWKWRGQVWAHLVSDNSYEELHAFAARLGLPRRSFQGDHYDVPSDFREHALALGASAVTSRELVSRLRAAGLRRRPSGTEVALAWKAAIEQLGGSTEAATRTGHELERRYREPHRRYHTDHHVCAVLARAADIAEAVGLSGPDRALVTLAVCAHDVVYDACPGEDEQASAEWARLRLCECGLPSRYGERVSAAVLATATHAHDDDDVVIDVLLDSDLAILAAPLDVYDRYVAGVRVEYGTLDDSAWRQGRAKVLANLAQRQSLFFTSAARARWESAARANVQRELRGLAQG
jgi:predicted metal-dependent HD superfamily phosphohydrolase